MRLTNTSHRAPTECRQPGRTSSEAAHPTLVRALEAHRGDTLSMPGRFDPSEAFLQEIRQAGLGREEVRRALGSGQRIRRWDGCLLVTDRFLGIELELDPSGTIGITARRVR